MTERQAIALLALMAEATLAGDREAKEELRAAVQTATRWLRMQEARNDRQWHIDGGATALRGCVADIT